MSGSETGMGPTTVVENGVLGSHESHYRQLLEHLPAGAYTCDAEGLITYYNAHAVKVWGREPALNNPIDRYCGSFKLYNVDCCPIRHDECWMALALREAKGFNGQEILIERPDGSRIIVLAHANPIHDAQGKLIGAVNVLVDISDQKHAQEVLRDADQVKNEFLATLAHELRNPLAPIRNAVAIMHLNDSQSPEMQWALTVVDRQMQHMTRLIDDLMDIARISGKKLQLRKERVELAEVIRLAVETSRPAIDAADQEFSITLPSQPLLLDADMTRIGQVVSNLLNNASKYTERGGRISLICERQGSDAVIIVRDSGMGIAPELLPHIFEMFTQGVRAIDRSQGGLGIGLALVKRLVEMHEGSIVARSEGAGKGSEFVVRLPALIQQPQPRAIPGAALDQPPSRKSSLRLVVVDDNRDSAASMGMLLRVMGHEVRTAHDGMEAYDLIETFRPQVALLDIGMPKMNGYEVAEKIRQQPWGQGIVLIAVSGWGLESDRQKSKAAGFDHHLVKPLDPTTLIRLLAPLEQALLAKANDVLASG